MNKKGTIIALVLIVAAILFAVINPSIQRAGRIYNNASELPERDSLWQSYCKNGDTASTKIRTNQWVIIGNAKDMLNPFSDTVLSTYWQMVDVNRYVVTCKKYGSITVEFCRPLPDSSKD